MSDDRRQETVKAPNGEGIRDVTDLAVYRKAYAVSLDIHHLSMTLPKHEQNELAAQMRRASKSVCANLAEGFGKQSTSKPEFKRYIQMAIGSADEMRLWLQYVLDLGYADRKTITALQMEYRDIAKMLTGLHRKWS
jgi:four helix bundle protein